MALWHKQVILVPLTPLTASQIHVYHGSLIQVHLTIGPAYLPCLKLILHVLEMKELKL